MKPRYIKRIIKEDFPEEVQEWIDTLLYPLNAQIEQTNLILEKNITLNDNIVAAFKTITIEGASVIRADTTAASNILSNVVYYQGNIDGKICGLQEGQKIQGVGIVPGTTVQTVSGSTVTLSQAVQYTQKGAEFLCGGLFPFTFQHGLTVRPEIVLLVKTEDTASIKPPLISGVTAQWELLGSSVVISSVTGLTAGRQYKLTFLVL